MLLGSTLISFTTTIPLSVPLARIESMRSLSEVRKGNENLPRVLILSPVKDGKPFIETYFQGLQNLDYPADKLSLALLESDSTDGTFEALAKQIEKLRHRFTRVELYKRDYNFRPIGTRSDSNVQLLRRAILARSRNYLLTRALRDEDWVLWLDFDVIDYPTDVIQQLLSKNRPIVVPHCTLAPGGRTFDLNTFIQTAAPNFSDAPILQPEKGDGRKYIEDMRDHDLVEVDGVGGTMLLIKADLHREGLFFPVAPYKKHIETEGLAFLARDMGERCWGAPRIEVIHANH